MNSETDPYILGKPLGAVLGGLVVIVIAVLIGLAVYSHYQQLPFKQTAEIVKEEVKRSKSAKRKPGMLDRTDAWGNQLCLDTEKSDMAIFYEVTSPGPDGEFETEDDIAAQAVDLNKSRMVGTWAGEKIKEGAKGFIDGLKKKSDFEEE
jgi:hypothetical protein